MALQHQEEGTICATSQQQSRTNGDEESSGSECWTPKVGWYRSASQSGSKDKASVRNDTPIDIVQHRAHLDILKVNAGASPAAIRRAFLRRAVEEHPDKGGSAEAFAQVQAAYRALSMHAGP
ncbi:hypothetical protein COCSUDRAFT_83703 [Coccomyxa subellipsoidea C-169]|uniref:J domain-containing protein n=1 Tax=Coccomyxa subellipsoidea (strain C-169) TaxID=574566 RepID=I0YX12_COCSC|nr:hypothetical protein COCSUDRAFT_83703 [Coccomyxa subellipsoidea C-169]EIE22931.1 hypothetical protein COCSUDRAFT_83703 [Coccomyxa subellipsoidea C-169]|eukprot:XP_005647475.1 hypothetical protein COCSUDRAFT_83703 [Coccomyxa subellipsoidea C-169]